MNQKLGILIAVVVLLAVGYLVVQQQQNNPPSQEPSPTPTSQAPVCSSGNDIVKVGKNTELGDYLTDDGCRTLYVFAKDKNTQSSCFDECAKNWPPFQSQGKNPTDYKDILGQRLNVIERKDGIVQYAYGDKPLYYYKLDEKPGDTKGHGLNDGQWAVVPLE